MRFFKFGVKEFSFRIARIHFGLFIGDELWYLKDMDGIKDVQFIKVSKAVKNKTIVYNFVFLNIYFIIGYVKRSL